MAEDCQFSARSATQAQRAVETDLFVLEGLAGSYLLNSRSQNDLGGGPRMSLASVLVAGDIEPPAGIPRPTRSPPV
jgi:hypothetical protein